MKNNLENKFNELLRDYEAPFDANAWSKFDQHTRTIHPSSTRFTKWIAATAVIIAASAIVLNYFIPANKDLSSETIAENSIHPEENTTPLVDESNLEITEGTKESFEKETQVNLTDKLETTPNIPSKRSDRATEQPHSNGTELPETNFAQGTDNDSNEDQGISEQPKEVEIFKVPSNTSNHYVAGFISATDICYGESIEIKNTSDKPNDIVRARVNGKVVSLNSGKSMDVILSSSTVVSFLDQEDQTIAQEKINVNALPVSHIRSEENIYTDGLPVAHFETVGSYKSITWYYNDQQISNEAHAEITPFNKGQHTVTLKLVDYNGCENAIGKTIDVKENYNLMAMSAFRPNGYDHRNKTFMPYALKERNVKFVLQIIDPRDNGIVFSSNDPSNGWDGIDQRNGTMTPSETVYIWKVQLENPIKGESPVYAGTVMHH